LVEALQVTVVELLTAADTELGLQQLATFGGPPTQAAQTFIAVFQQLGPAQGQGGGEWIGIGFEAPQGLQPGHQIAVVHEPIAAGMTEGPFEIEPTEVPVPAEALQLPISRLQLVAPVVGFTIGLGGRMGLRDGGGG